jgi:hypothetical protein
MKKKNIIRVGDMVKIISPEFFIRCGYPLTIDMERENVRKNYQDKINKFIYELVQEEVSKSSPNKTVTHGFYDREFYRTENEIANALAYAFINAKKFGGYERKIYTEHHEDIRDKILRVSSIFFVKTGTYSPGHWYSCLDEEDWEPACLVKEKTHKILSLDCGYITSDSCNGTGIEAANVEKVQEETNNKDK